MPSHTQLLCKLSGLLIILIIESCATTPKPSIPPKWWNNTPQDALYYYGVGSAAIKEEEWSAWEAARDQGLQDIAHQVETRINAMQADYNRQTDNSTPNFFIRMSVHITQVILCDTKPIQRNRNNGNCYVLLASPKDKARAIITESIDDETKKNPLFQTTAAKEAMNKWLKQEIFEPIPTVQQQLAAAQDKIKNLEARLATSESDRVNLQNGLNEALAEISRLQDTIKERQLTAEQSTDLQSRLNEALAEISRLQDIIVDQTNEIRDITYKLTVREQDIDRLQNLRSKEGQ